jgi:hypothetical protein
VNRDRLIDTIAGNAGDRRTASFVTAAINSWVAVNGIRGEIEIPGDVIRQILAWTTGNQQSLVVRFAPEDPERTVHLLQKQEPGHRVGEGHL